MFLSVDDNGDGELNAPEFADFERIVRARAVDTSRRALKVILYFLDRIKRMICRLWTLMGRGH